MFVDQGHKLTEEVLLERLGLWAPEALGRHAGSAPERWVSDAMMTRMETEWRVSSALQSACEQQTSSAKRPKTGQKGAWRHPVAVGRGSWSRRTTWEDVFLDHKDWISAGQTFAVGWQEALLDSWPQHLPRWVAMTLDSWRLNGTKLWRKREELAEARRKQAEDQSKTKRRRVWVDEMPAKPQPRRQDASTLRVRGDNSAVVGWIQGRMKCKDKLIRKRVQTMQRVLHDALERLGTLPERTGAEYFEHIIREGNTEAESQATRAMQSRQGHLDNMMATTSEPMYMTRPFFLRLHSDGGCKDGQIGSGFVVDASDKSRKDFKTILRGSEFGESGDSLLAEVRAAELAVLAATLLQEIPCHQWQSIRMQHFTNLSKRVDIEQPILTSCLNSKFSSC